MVHMRLTEHERERLLITLAADVAERRRGRGLKLNHPEAVAILTSFVPEGAAADAAAGTRCRPVRAARGRHDLCTRS
jgi:urease gamma subunit